MIVRLERRNSTVHRLLVRSLLGGVVLAGLLALPLRADDPDKVERYLSRLGLVDLLTLHLEQQIQDMPAGEQRKRAAERLADLYANQLIEKSEDKSSYGEVLQRIQRLIERVPEAKTASLEVMLLQADYFRAETLVTKWLADHAAQSERSEAAEILGRIAPQLHARQQELNATLERLASELDDARDPEEQELKLQEFGRVQSVAGRAAFFAGWANYYLALASPESKSSHHGYQAARDVFRKILGIEGGYAQLEPDSLGLESIWRARTLIGLAMAEAAAGNLAGAQACFEILQRAPAPGEILDLAPYWRLQSLLNAGQFAEALKYAQSQVAGWAGEATQGRVSFCTSLVQAGYGTSTNTQPPARELGPLGVTGLIKLRQLAALRQLIDKYRIPLDQPTGFYLLWLKGQQELESAEKSRRPEDYAAASRSLTAALDSADAKSDLPAAAQCRYQLAWCQYRLEQFTAAAVNYEQAREGLKLVDRNAAADATWMAFVCYHTLAQEQRQYAAAAINLLTMLQREFPDHSGAKRADYYKNKLQQAGLSPEQTIANLERIPASSPDYLAARFDICRTLYETWNAASESQKQERGRQLLDAASQFLVAAERDSDDARRLRVCVYAADAALQNQPADLGEAEKFMETARNAARDVPDAGLLAEYHYRSLQLASQRDDEAKRQRHAQWLVENAPGTVFELPALIIVAKAQDRQRETSPQSRAVLEQGYEVYQQLVARLGDTQEAVKSQKNAQAALSRLADYAEQLGHYPEASQHLQTLVSVFPEDQGYLRRAGLATFQARRFAESVEHWRVLTVGLPKGSEGWFEAKYYQLACLAEVDPAKAAEAMRQFRLLYPRIEFATWQGKFAELQARLPQ